MKKRHQDIKMILNYKTYDLTRFKIKQKQIGRNKRRYR